MSPPRFACHFCGLALVQNKGQAIAKSRSNHMGKPEHDRHEYRDQPGRHAEAGQSDPKFTGEGMFCFGVRFRVHDEF
jgi:hypothetical protein